MKDTGAVRHRLSTLQRVALAAVFVAVGLLALRQVGSLDVGFHLRAGEYIVSGEGWPRTDPFTFTVSDHEYVDTSWGYQVAIHLIHRFAGVQGLSLFHAALVLTAFGLLLATVRLVDADPDSAAWLLLLGGVASEMRFEARPEHASYLLLALVLYLLHRRAEGLRSPLWLLPWIHLLWANTHSLFILGWAVTACFVIGIAYRERRVDRKLLGWSLLSLAAPLLNPYGWRGLVFPFTLATRLRAENVFNQTIGEFVSPFSLGLSEMFPFFPHVPIYSFRLLAVLVLISALVLLRRGRLDLLLLVPIGILLSFRMIRNIPILVVVCLPGAIRTLPVGELMRRGAARVRVGRISARMGPVALIVLALVLGLRTVTDAYYISGRRDERFGVGWNRLALPVDAVEFVRSSALSGRALNHLNFGGYLMWARREPVFIDGRLEVVGERFFDHYRKALGSSPALEASVRSYGIRWVILPYRITGRLLGRMSRDPRWRLLYVDHLAVIFARNDGAPGPAPSPDAVHAAEGPHPTLDAETLPGLGGGARASGARRWLSTSIARQRFPTRQANLGLFHHFRGEWARAAHHFAKAILESDGAYYELYNNLGSALYRMGRLEHARRCYGIVLEDVPENRLARKRVAEIDGRLPRRPGP